MSTEVITVADWIAFAALMCTIIGASIIGALWISRALNLLGVRLTVVETKLDTLLKPVPPDRGAHTIFPHRRA